VIGCGRRFGSRLTIRNSDGGKLIFDVPVVLVRLENSSFDQGQLRAVVDNQQRRLVDWRSEVVGVGVNHCLSDDVVFVDDRLFND
jgi:hypothetical protein